MVDWKRLYGSLKHLLDAKPPEKSEKPHEHNYDSTSFFRRLPLKDGHHTSLSVYHCSGCPHATAMPSANLQLALEKGTDETLNALKEFEF